MSADNGIYILQSKDGYRVIEAQAIDNLNWWHICCNNPNIKDISTSMYVKEKCINCGKINPKMTWKENLNPKTLLDYFGGYKVFKTEKEALKEAVKINKEILDEGYWTEYGICFIPGWENKEFPKEV